MLKEGVMDPVEAEDDDKDDSDEENEIEAKGQNGKHGEKNGVSGKCFIAYRCKHIRKHMEALQNDSDTDDDGKLEEHEVCPDCDLVNRYGEPIALVDTKRFILSEVSSPLKQNLEWFKKKRAWLTMEMGRGGHMAGMRTQQKFDEMDKAKRDTDIAQGIVGKAEVWAGEMMRAAKAQKR